MIRCIPYLELIVNASREDLFCRVTKRDCCHLVDVLEGIHSSLLSGIPQLMKKQFMRLFLYFNTS